MNSGLYTIKNIQTGMSYIGRTANWNKRRMQHIADLRANRHDNKRLQHSWNKRGAGAFVFSLAWPEREEKLVELEGFVLDFLFDKGRLYNMHKNSRGGLLGMVMPEEAKLKLAKSRANSIAVKAHIAWLSSPENQKAATITAAAPEARAKAVATRNAHGYKAFSDTTRQNQKDAARIRVFSALDWAVG